MHLHPILAAGQNAGILPVLALALLAVVGVSLVLWRLKQPLLPGFFLCGLLVAQSGMVNLAPGSESALVLQQMAEIGVLLLMFTIGVESPLAEFWHMRRLAVVGGGLQVLMTTAAGAGIALAGGMGLQVALFCGFLLALSSTAVGVKLFPDNALGQHPGARFTLAIALFQDSAVILFLLLLPALQQGGGAAAILSAGGLLAVEGALFLALSAVLSRYAIPHILKRVVITGSRELFTLAVLALCAGVASMGHLLGLNAALGAFAAGVTVSGTLYSHRILADASTFRDLFLTIFFLSVGAFLDLGVLAAGWWWLVPASLAILALKGVLIHFAARIARFHLRGGILSAAALGGVGEFAIVLANDMAEKRLIPESIRQFFLIEVALTLCLSPMLMKLAVKHTRKLESSRAAVPQGKADVKSRSQRIRELTDHAILCGYGTVGRILHRSLVDLGIPVVIIELNAATVKELMAEGHMVLFADIAQADTLHLAGVERARVIAVTFPHPEAARGAIATARAANPAIATLCRARFPSDIALLEAAGANVEVVHDERESGIRMLQTCLTAYERDPAEIQCVLNRLDQPEA